MERTERGHNTRAQWTEAESLVFSKLRSGIHPQTLEGQIREQLRLPLDSYYRQSYLLHALKILRNLCNNNAFAYLPTLQQYQKLKRDGFLLAKFKADMNGHFSDDKYLHRIATEGAIQFKFGTSPWLKQTSVAANLSPSAACPEFDEEAKELIKSMEEGAARDLEQQHKGTVSALLQRYYYLHYLQ
jgi:hypothetical protein